MTIPDDFAANWQIMTREELAGHYGIAVQNVSKICHKLGLKRSRTPRPVPENFADVAQLSERVLRARFSCGVNTIRRWRRELDISARRVPEREPTALRIGVEDKSAALAAKYLQRTRPVYRCDADGRFGGSNYWRCGREVLADAGLVEKAKSLGWDAGEWRRVVPAHLNTIAQGGVA